MDGAIIQERQYSHTRSVDMSKLSNKYGNILHRIIYIKKPLVIFLTLISLPSFANVSFVKFEIIPEYEEYSEQFDFLMQNVPYYNHWHHDWPFDVGREFLVKGLRKCFDIFSRFDNQNVEINLLLGDVSHYLYNLNENKYSTIAESYYEKAIEKDPNDYRTYWFIANHYALSNNPEKSIEYFKKGQRILPEDEPAAFWEEYAYAAHLAFMPSHSIYAMDKARSILGASSYFEEQLGQTIRNRIIRVNSDSAYDFRDIWAASRGDLISFVSRPLGLKLLIDSTWQIDLYDYENMHAFVVIVPPAIANESGREITYTIVLIIEVAHKGDSLSGFINNLISKYPDRNRFDVLDKYPDMISYELRDRTTYQDIGGAHAHVIGVQRDRPKYAGLLLEKPISIQPKESDQPTLYRAGDIMDRFDGVIYYTIMLDTCEDIYEEAFRLFMNMFENQIFIE